jgi:hypothetical protein
MLLVDLDLDAEFAAELEQAADSVVVWAPADDRFPSRLSLPRLTEVIRKLYRPEARFGRIEVWRPIAGPAQKAFTSNDAMVIIGSGRTGAATPRRPTPHGARDRSHRDPQGSDSSA